MSLKRFEGKTVDEALDNAAEELGVERYRLSYHVVVEKRGFLGGTKRVVIEAWEDDFGNRLDAPKPPAATPERQARVGAGAGPRRSENRAGGRGRGGRRDRDDRPPRGGGRRQRGSREEAAPRREEALPDFEPGPAPPVSDSETEASRALREWFNELFRLGGLEMEARAEESDDRFLVRIYGGDIRRLLLKHGELLDSLQIIANKTVTVRSTQKTVELDVGEFREKRIEELERQARAVADQVREDAKERALPSMSPVERRIVHLALRDDQDVETYSRGDGFYKRVVVTPRRSASGSAET
jgi:spoIIIJ-associated protein